MSPPSAAQDIAANRPLRWGVLGTGRIAHDFCAAIVAAAPTNCVAMIAGRSPRAAAQMAATYGGRPTTAEGEAAYAELARAPDVDIVYIGTVQSQHEVQILLCVSGGKHVLCEKPMGLNAAQTRAAVAAARRAGVLLVEGHWTYALPAMKEAWLLLKAGAIGELQSVASDFTYPARPDPALSSFQKACGGGASLVLGVYPMCAALRAFGPPEHVHATGELGGGAGPVDVRAQVSMGFAGGRTAVASYGFCGAGPQTTTFVGSTGRLTLHEPAHAPTKLTLERAAGGRGEYACEERAHALPVHPQHLPPLLHPHSEGLVYEVREVEAAVRARKTECEMMPLEASVQLAEAMDEVRKQLRLAYAQDLPRARIAASCPALCAAAPYAAAFAAGAVLAALARRACSRA